MISRTLEVSSRAHIAVRHSQLKVSREGKEDALFPIEDIGVLILDNPAITITQAAIAACQANNVALIISDKRHLPQSVMLSLGRGHSLHSKIVRRQIQASDALKARLWKQLVMAKVGRQADVLAHLERPSEMLRRLARSAKKGDPENVEAQAARYYWPLLFDKAFRRSDVENSTNSMLNYGYAILRATTARSIVASGLHPALGLHHKNQYNDLCLADDLMEPLRPLVDWAVLAQTQRGVDQLDREVKTELLNLINLDVSYANKKMPLGNAILRMGANVRDALLGETKQLVFPIWTLN